jgi:LuxR family maltose regulon positive regulatory protein
MLTDTLDLAALLVMQGQLSAAADMYQQVIASAEKRSRFASEAFIGKGSLHYEWNELGAAEQHFEQALALAQQIEGPRLLALGCVGLARVMQARGESERAAELFAQALAQAERSGQAEVREQVLAYQVRCWLCQGEREQGGHWRAAHPFTRQDAPSYAHEIVYLTFCRVLIAQGEAADALQMLEDWQAFARTQRRTGSELEMACSVCWRGRPWAKKTRRCNYSKTHCGLPRPKGISASS